MPEQSPDVPILSRKFTISSFALIVLVGILIYANSLGGQFLWDDESLVQFNPYIKNWSYLPKIFKSRMGSIAKEAGAFYRPVQTLTYLVDYSFWKLDVVGYHVTNMVWHILAALSVFGLVQALFRNGKLALLTSLLFVTHPVHTEAVAYVSGRADSLAAFFMLSAFILYLKHDQRKKWTILVAMSASYLLALLSKEYCLILPPLVWFTHYALKRPVDKKAFTVLVSTMFAYILWRGLVVGVGTIAQGAVPTLTERLPGIFISLTTYFRLLVLPFDLHMEYGGILFRFSEPKAIIGVILMIVLGVFVMRKKEKDRFLFFSVGWFFIALLPSLNLLFAINAYMAEHWLYVPLIGYCLIVARFLIQLSESQKTKGFAVLAALSLIVFYSVLTIRQNSFWNNGINFYQRMLIYAPDSSRLYNNLAKAYHDAGKNDELIELLKTSIQKQSDNALAHNNLGNAYKEIGKYKKAIASYEMAIKIDPEHAGPYYNLSTIYNDIEKKPDVAIQLLNKSIEMSPYFSKSYNKLGLIYLEQGKKEEAIALLNKALKLNPDDPEVYHNFGYIYINTGNVQNAIRMYKKAIEVDSNYVEAYHDLAVIYLSNGDYRLAIEYCDRSVAMGYVDHTLLDRLKQFR